jgi:hypothetical protein
MAKVNVIEVKFTKMTTSSPKFAPSLTNVTGTELLVSETSPTVAE